MNVLASPLVAIEFLTRFRLRRKARGDMRAVAASQAWFPAVGLLIGLALVGVDRLAMRALPPASVDVLVVVALVAVTGALHLDGLADAADGLLGGATRERRLAIMRDVQAGTYAIVAVVCVLAMKWAGLTALPSNVRIEAILLVPCLARFAMLVGAEAYPPARPDGLAAALQGGASRTARLLAGATAVGAAWLLLGSGGLGVAAAAAIAGLAFGWIVTRALHGVTGDTHGATIEMSEALLWLLIAALANRGWLDALALG